jgi:DnaK suppressor protein
MAKKLKKPAKKINKKVKAKAAKPAKRPKPAKIHKVRPAGRKTAQSRTPTKIETRHIFAPEPLRKAGRPAKSMKSSKNAKPLSPSPIIKTKIVALKTPALIITRSQTTPPPVLEKPLSASEISKYRTILQQKREDLAQLVARKKEMEFQEVEPEIGDEADIATASVEKDILYEMTDVEQQNLDSVEAALRKIEKGVFGKCEVCGQQIPRMRLEVMPWARNCVFCQSKNETPAPAAPAGPAQAE